MTTASFNDVNDILFVRLIRYEIDQMVAWAGECLEKGDYGGYARASLRIQRAMESLEKDENT